MKFVVEITERENTYQFAGEWDNPSPEGYIEAENDDEAVELMKTYLEENGEDPDRFIYRVWVR